MALKNVISSWADQNIFQAKPCGIAWTTYESAKLLLHEATAHCNIKLDLGVMQIVYYV